MAASSIPLFPLNTVLFPGGILPLQIFEVRYLDMIGKCIAEHTEFGIVPLISGSEVRQADKREVLAPVGTMAGIEEWSRPQAGLIRVVARGAQRFRILSSEAGKNGLWVGEVEMMEDDLPVTVPIELQNAADMLASLIASLKSRGGDGVQLPMREPFNLGDCGWVANRWCELLPIATSEKEHLMALDNPMLRLELVQDLLDQFGLGTEA
jgi:Lon protease-like protein